MAKPIALQMYSLREEAAADLIGTLRKVAEIGYVGVEPDELQGMRPEEYARVASDLGMKVCSTWPTALPENETMSEFMQQQRAFGTTIVVLEPDPSEYETVETVTGAAAALEEKARSY
jgi:sugar phosphate isomerase/epimerase